MPVPAAESQRDAPRPGGDQPARDQEIVDQARPAVVAQLIDSAPIPVAELLVFFFDVKCLGQFARGEHAERLLRERVGPGDLTRNVCLAAEAIERIQDGPAISEPIE